jgi:hypothetical protein
MMRKLIKPVIAISMIICSSSTLFGQQRDTSNQDKWMEIPKRKSTYHVIQSNGYTFNSDQLSRIPARNINKIAGTVPGVEYREGEAPIIRGAKGGTAYFIDGVRVHGTLPNIAFW